MGKAWIGVGARVVVEFTLSLFAGLEAVEGWILGNPVAWLASFAGWPLYASLSFFAIGMFILGSIHLIGVCRESLDHAALERQRRAGAHRDALAETMEGLIGLYEVQPLARPMERLSLIHIGESELARFDLDAPDDISDSQRVIFYQRLLPYLQRSVEQAQEMARSWKQQLEADD